MLLEGDFVRLVRPPASTTATSRKSQERLLHVSAATTFRFPVPRRVQPQTTGHTLLPPAGGNSGGDVSGSSVNGGKFNSAAAAAAAGAGREQEEEEEGCGEREAWRSVSLGDIAARALALRRQFVARSVAVTAAGSGRQPGSVRCERRNVKVAPAVFGSGLGQAAAVADGMANAARVALNSTALTAAPATPATMTMTPTTTATNATVSTAATDRRLRQDYFRLGAPTAAATAAAALGEA